MFWAFGTASFVLMAALGGDGASLVVAGYIGGSVITAMAGRVR